MLNLIEAGLLSILSPPPLWIEKHILKPVHRVTNHIHRGLACLMRPFVHTVVFVYEVIHPGIMYVIGWFKAIYNWFASLPVIGSMILKPIEALIEKVY